MSKFRTSILIIGLLIIVIAASLLTVLALYATGAVITERIELVYTVIDAKKDYDGTPLFPEEYELTYGELLNGHYAVVEFTGSQTEVGQSRSGLSVKIYDANNYDVTSEYKIGVVSGHLNVNPRYIKVVLDDEEVVYNGTKVNFDNYTITEGELVAGHKIAGSQNVQLINVNDVLPSDLNVLVFDVTGKNVTKNYNVDFSYNKNRIRVVQRPLTVRPVDIIKVYDGVEVNLNEIEILAGSLAEGQYFKSIEINNGSSRIVDATSSDIVTTITNIEICQRVGSTEVSVTENYNLDLSETGIVRIEKRKLTITAKSQSWEYDGTDHFLTDDHTPLSCEGLAPGEELASINYFGSINGVGVEKNEITEIKLSDNASLDNYEVVRVSGTLTVVKREITIITPTVSKTYDGTPLYGASTNEKPTVINLAPYHLLDYKNEDLKEQTTVGTITNSIDCRIIDQFDSGEEKTDLSSNYKITYSYGTITVTKRSARVSTSTVSKPFDGETLYAFQNEEDVDTYNILSGHHLDLPTGDKIPQITNVGKKYTDFTVAIMDSEGNYVTENYDIDYQFGYLEITRLEITVRTLGDSIEYAGEALQLGEENTEFKGLPEGFEKVLVEEDYPKQEGVGKKKNAVHYTFRYGGAPVDENNYNIEYSYGELEITPCELYLNLKNYNEIYNGGVLQLTLAEVLAGNYLKFLAVEDFTLKPSQDEIRNAGSYSYSVELNGDFDISNFEIRITGGSINIAKCEVAVQLKGYTDWIYDGETVSLDVDDAIISYNRVDGQPLDHLNKDAFRIVTSGTLKNAGEYTYTVRFKNTSDDRNHELYLSGGDIAIAKYPITLDLLNKTGTNAEQYDGSSHLPTAQEAINDASLQNTKLEKSAFKVVAINGDAVNASDVLYTYTVQMIDSREAENYEIRVNPGSIKVNKCEVNLTLSNFGDLTYNGKSQIPTTNNAIAGGLPTHLNEKYSMFEVIVTDGDMKSGGKHYYTVAFRNPADEDNHTLTITNENGVGEVDIGKCEIELEMKYYTEEYNAEVHELSFENLVGFVSCADAKLITGENLDRYFELYCLETIKDAGSYSYGIRFISRDDYDNFELKLTYSDAKEGAKFEVTQVKVRLVETVGLNPSKTYDGKVYTLVADNYLSLSSDTELKFVDSLSATGETSSSTVGLYNITFDGRNVRIYNSYGENISRNLEITNSVVFDVEIRQRNITYTLDNYLCKSDNVPRYVTAEIRNCFGISTATPLLSGYYIGFEDDLIIYNFGNGTLIVDDFESVTIYNEEGENVTGNFNVTNEDRLTSSVIVIG